MFFLFLVASADKSLDENHAKLDALHRQKLKQYITTPEVRKSLFSDPQRESILFAGATEPSFSNMYYNSKEHGVYLCPNCGAVLFASDDKFDSRSGWPSFDRSENVHAVKEVREADGRTEIRCSACDVHLGHVFRNEGFTPLNTRHCVNSASLKLVEYAYLGGGCFWGVEHLLENAEEVMAKGIIDVESGYMGETRAAVQQVAPPTYALVSSGRSQFAEVVRVAFDPDVVSYDHILRRFFEIHDPTQADRQGPDVGRQYRSVIFTASEKQREAAQNVIDVLERKLARAVSTEVVDVYEDSKNGPGKLYDFYYAEDYHQDYYKKSGKQPYCHRYEDRGLNSFREKVHDEL